MEPRWEGQRIIRQINHHSFYARVQRATPKPKPSTPATFHTFPEALKRGYLWHPVAGVYECPKCPGRQTTESTVWKCRHLEIRPRTD